jgi:hypothetical protein
MKPEDIISEIHRHRERLARRCGNDVKKLMEYYRKQERERETKGHQLVSFAEPFGTSDVPYALQEKASRRKK